MSISQLVDTKTHLIPGKLKVSELFFEVPLDYSNESKGSIRIFARSVIRHENPAAKSTEEEIRKSSQKPWFVYLQGGPGFGCRPPQDAPITNVVLDKGYQMLYIDQRGTGLSNPISAATLAFTGWSVFGQSFGGFCVLTYLSFHHQGLREVFTSGGLAPVGHSADRVYRATFQKVIERNRAYYQKFPEDVAVIQGLAIHISAKNGLQMPSGGTLTVRMFLTMGINFGFHGGLDMVHDIVLRMSSDLDQFSFVTKPTLKAIEDMVRSSKTLSEYKWLSGRPRSPTSIISEPLYFSGEMIYPFMFETSPELSSIYPAAKLLAEYTDWPPLYDEWQLARNEVPMYAATYVDDMYVDFGLAQETVRLVRGCKQWVTNGMYHDAVRSRTGEMMGELFGLRDDVVD
ncbi:hypothetical protein SS1G_02966 [Sclerotinia sclerotiorum 1980 UF-70]|uniref:AB hydrolase-1 domain-containing protein n=1 Tax=Sclerotinia sclerotiorum (strain ATCC 18683 / 1980 / Ss-1) TaxID=665079 RepID=A7ECC7_SCLS1|nr:hypothetical protein SS1G_02966 [Sclerotinia sclerotiorum 1980 UF-70]EDO00106.1 hypothetical protein SS1G_02966 [Sclerotinia sclerotiorum 1980 UF-70]